MKNLSGIREYGVKYINNHPYNHWGLYYLCSEGEGKWPQKNKNDFEKKGGQGNYFSNILIQTVSRYIKSFP